MCADKLVLLFVQFLGLQVAFLFHEWAMRLNKIVTFYKNYDAFMKEMALRLHIEEKFGDAFIKKNDVAFTIRLRCVYRKGKKNATCPPR